MKKVIRFILFIFFFIPLKILFPAKVIGRGNIPKGQKYMTVSNHLHFLDSVLLWFYLPGFKHFLAKKELGEKRFARGFLSMLGAIFIDREKPDLRAIKVSVAALKKSPLAVFPEGTRNKADESLQAVKGGAAMIAAKADVPIMPVIIHHRTKLFRKNYMYFAPAFNLPYGSKDRFGSDALRACTDLLTEEMSYSKELLNIAVANHKPEKKRLKAQLKEAKRNFKREK